MVNALNLGATAENIMQITSHSDYKAMKPYIKATLEGSKSVIDAIEKTYIT